VLVGVKEKVCPIPFEGEADVPIGGLTDHE
jgi:hypothetical protein